ncbi:MAG: FAD-dependent oxidoreductase [Myxococcales bacterium]|nr:FAD-dependent oxidoreductase [Myxococcales bacterium]
MTAGADVIVVGAGLAGLMAARMLRDKGVDVIALEARDRVGGRTRVDTLQGAPFDLGGQWISSRHHRMRDLCEEFGLQTFPTHHAGKKVLDLDGRLSTHRHAIPSLSYWSLWVLSRTLAKSERLRRTVPLDAPWETPDAARLDGLSVADLSRDFGLSRTVQELFDVAVRTVFGAEPTEISALYFAFYLNSSGGLRRLIEIKDGAQERRVTAGAGEIAKRLAADLGSCLVTDTPVRRIAHRESGVLFGTSHGTMSARLAILALPPKQALAIEYEPELPPGKRALLDGFRMGSTAKVFVFYAECFWRDAGYSGEVTCAIPRGATTPPPLTWVVDNSTSDAKVPCLLGFRVGAPGRHWRSRPEAERRAAIIAQLVRYFGPKAASPIAIVEHDWDDDEWAAGCPVAAMPPGLMTQHGRLLRDAVGPLHWAGTETAEDFCGFMEGALESGERAASEVLALL